MFEMWQKTSGTIGLALDEAQASISVPPFDRASFHLTILAFAC